MSNLEEQVAQLQAQLDAMKKQTPSNKLSMIVFSGDLDKALAAFIIATGATAMGMEVVMFFTFWGTPILRDKNKTVSGKDTMGKMFGAMLPKGAGKTTLSKMNMGGMGTAMMKSLMKQKNVASLEEMIALAEELGVKIFICEMSMDLMGFKREEMIDYEGKQYVGVATFLAEASDSKIQLFL
ncbi:MAG: DsrE/DsrF/DrsH-like family protein [Desulfobacterales bacterium]|jgi:peroxiredoxin family protein|nr:DsrE/DsrF/DrsH-like family protein [Desulfobacterales bacterium]MDX2511424.1 DsrE/DsrF/DrsH-like family protein [Desulfobacterales bacterium]